MKKVYFIGDCHLSRVSEHYNKDNSNIDFTFWGKAAKKIWDIDFNQMYLNDELSSGKEKQNFYNDGVIPFSNIDKNGIIFFWFGYVDIRTFLPKHNDAEEVVKKYINEIIKNFDKNKSYIIEPLPQFTEMLLKYEGISPYYTHEERLEQNKLFLNYLYKYCKEFDIKILITQKEILDAIGHRELTPNMTHDFAPHPVDGLKPEYNKKIFNLFENKVTEILIDKNK